MTPHLASCQARRNAGVAQLPPVAAGRSAQDVESAMKTRINTDPHTVVANRQHRHTASLANLALARVR